VLTSDRPTDCANALTHTFDTSSTIEIIKEYQPTVFFPEVLFAGPHTFGDYDCSGSYAQSITIDAAKTGVTLVDAPAGSDKRPYVAIDGTAQVTTFTLTFTGTYTFHTVVITDTFTQSYSLKTVFSTDYLEMPVITNTLAVLSIIPANVGDTPPTQTMAAADASFSYSFKDLTDPFGNTPPACKPVAYSTMTGADLTPV